MKFGHRTSDFVGSFDGQKFVADDIDYPLWLDYGTDNYAGVTWSNVPDRTIYIGWMNNNVLLYSTRNYIHYPVTNHNGKEYENICLYN